MRSDEALVPERLCPHLQSTPRPGLLQDQEYIESVSFFLPGGFFLSQVVGRLITEETRQARQRLVAPVVEHITMHLIISGQLPDRLFFSEHRLDHLALNSALYCFRVFFCMNLFPPYEPIKFCLKF
jgi:hypothetical protein